MFEFIKKKKEEEEPVTGWNPYYNPLPWYTSLYYSLWRGKEKVVDFPREVKWFCQRGWRGYADCDVWSMNSHLLDIMPKMIRELMRHNTGSPIDGKKIKTHKDWTQMLLKISKGLEAGQKLDGMEYCEFRMRNGKKTFYINKKRMKAYQDKFDESMKLIHKYFFNLWD